MQGGMVPHQRIDRSIAEFREFPRMTSTAPQAAPKPRPLSPHLQIYNQGFTGTLSILHRITGVGLSLALPVLVAWLVALARGPGEYASFMQCVTSPIGKLFLMGWAWAFSYHLCAGIRHLLWDTGWGFELKQVYLTGKIMIGTTALLTLILWVAILGA